MENFIRPVIIVGNWKMNLTIEEGVGFIQTLAQDIKDLQAKVWIAVPFTAISSLAKEAKELPIAIGAQNMHNATEGAFTGEIAGKMLKEAGAEFVILGHSERRKLFGETNAFINKKLKRALQEGIQPILCVGETMQEREQGEKETVVKTQLLECLAGIDGNDLPQLILAYEPVWAIGTGHTATSEEAQEMHHFCRETIAKEKGEDIASQIPIIYGGSVQPSNAADLMKEPDIDGVLIGKASLSVESFVSILNHLRTCTKTPEATDAAADETNKTIIHSYPEDL